jgi:hypothetical protein
MIRPHAIRPEIAEKAREVLQALADGKIEPWMVAHAREVLPSFTVRGAVDKSPIASVEHHDQERASEENEEARRERKVYGRVRRRDRICQIADLETFGPHSGKLEVDHEWGRGKAPTLVENCRLKCERHHHLKTDGKPSRLAHLLDFLTWATRRRYWSEVEKANGAIELERAQHPEARDA